LLDAITDVPGIRVGHFTDREAATGCTVVLCEAGGVGGVDVRGSAPGTRETDLLSPTGLVQCAHAVLLTGGSAFGLAAATGVVRFLEERGIGHDTGLVRVPIVPGAVLFDLAIGSSAVRPDAESGYAACLAATDGPPAQGSVGAGTGATVGKLLGMAGATKGGVGTASLCLAGGIVVGAIVAVNSLGDVVDPQTGRVVAGARGADGYVSAVRHVLAAAAPTAMPGNVGTNTTIGVVATNARLDKAASNKVAQMAQDGVALAVRPAHTMRDGDALFALATGTSEATLDVSLLGIAAAEVVARAIVRAVTEATSVAGVPAARDLTADGRARR
jgi:L-aminopeptidase/D-esterase-like protein